MRAADFVESYFDAWNHGDPVAVADHLAADGLYCDIPLHVQRNHDELIVYLRNFFSSYRHRYEIIGEILEGKNTVAFQYRMRPRGKSSGANGAAVYHGAEFISLNGDGAVNITDFYDIPNIEKISGIRSRKYAKSGLSREQLLEYKTGLTGIMRSQQLFLQPDLTLPRLAESVGCSVNHLSQVINSGFGVSFFDYVNQHRIEHAKHLLATLDEQGGAILNIAFTVGFNSNSAFYAAFKKCVGQTPAQYRRSQARKAH